MPETIIDTRDISEDEWLDRRREGIGGSDAAKALGMHPYVTPLELYYLKKGEIEPDDLSDNDYVHFGNVLEDVVANEFERRRGLQVWQFHRMIRHEKHPWMLGNPDRQIVGSEERAGLECKTKDKHAFQHEEWGPDGSDQVPEYVYLQCLHYMAITGWPVWYVAVLAGGNDFHWYELRRDEEEVQLLIQAESNFWRRLMDENPPPVEYSHDSAQQLVKKRYPGTSGETIRLPDRAKVVRGRYKMLTGYAKRAEKLAERCKAELLDMTGEASVGKIPGGGKVTRSRVEEKEISYTRSSYLNTRIY